MRKLCVAGADPLGGHLVLLPLVLDQTWLPTLPLAASTRGTKQQNLGRGYRCDAGGITHIGCLVGRRVGGVTAGGAGILKALTFPPLVAHAEFVVGIHVQRMPMELRCEFAHVPQPEMRNLLPISPDGLPYDFEVVQSTIVLRDCHAILRVQNAMPPPSRHEDDVTWVLESLVHPHLGVPFLDARQQEVEVHDRLVVLGLLLDQLALRHLLGSLRLEQHPMLPPVSHGIPS
mmetsp:Transcript_33397/g.94427  ORF Transcript_33397/g.94427 Transcript_33397/m.94427 type:complete len:231 (-) Transcript_33397:730-1422(-)